MCTCYCKAIAFIKILISSSRVLKIEVNSIKVGETGCFPKNKNNKKTITYPQTPSSIFYTVSIRKALLTNIKFPVISDLFGNDLVWSQHYAPQVCSFGGVTQLKQASLYHTDTYQNSRQISLSVIYSMGIGRIKLTRATTLHFSQLHITDLTIKLKISSSFLLLYFFFFE